MRSNRIHKALVNIQNRFMLCRLISVATRKYHDPNRRVQDVINDVIGWFADAEFATQQLRTLADLEAKLPAVKNLIDAGKEMGHLAYNRGE